MFPITIEVKEDVRKWAMIRNKRDFNLLFKKALVEMAEHWHEQFAKKHFQKPAHSTYSAYSEIKQKMGIGRPLVETGNLRDRITNPSGARISGTSNRVTLTMPYGRPARHTEASIRKRAAIVAKQKNIPFKTALSREYSKSGYGADKRQLFNRLITATTDDERRRLGLVLRDSVVKQMNESGPLQTKRIG